MYRAITIVYHIVCQKPLTSTDVYWSCWRMQLQMADSFTFLYSQLSIYRNYCTCLPKVHDLSDHRFVVHNHCALDETSHGCYACQVLRRCLPFSTSQIVSQTWRERTKIKKYTKQNDATVYQFAQCIQYMRWHWRNFFIPIYARLPAVLAAMMWGKKM